MAAVEERPPGSATPLPEPAMQVTLRSDGPWGSLVLQSVVMKDEPDICALLDRMTGAVDREKLKAEAAKKREELRSTHARLREGFYDRAVAQARRDLAEVDKITSLEGLARNRRTQTAPRGHDKTAREQAERNVATALRMRDEVTRTLPLLQYQLDCLECRIAGADEPQPTDEVKAVISSLDLPEDTSFRAA